MWRLMCPSQSGSRSPRATSTSSESSARICRDWPVEWVTVENHDPAAFPDVEETGDTYLENALLKATQVAVGARGARDRRRFRHRGRRPRRSAGPSVGTLRGGGATDEQNLDAMLRAVRGVPAGGRTARYRCVAAIAWPDGRTSHADGVCEGALVSKRRGVRGFGYDPVFVPAGWDETMAELTDEQKDRISHRGRAFRALAELLGGA